VQVRIDAEPRSDFGKGAARRLRREGKVPAVIYGRGVELQHVSLPAHDLELALHKPKVTLEVHLGADSVSVAPRQIQRDPVKRHVEHVDLVMISAAEAREREVEARLIAAAEAAAAEAGLDAVAVAEHAAAAVAEGASPEDAIAQAIEEVREAVAAAAASMAVAEAAEEAAGAEGTESTEAAAADSPSDEG
jgi:large subunit ribosomal protein L25